MKLLLILVCLSHSLFAAPLDDIRGVGADVKILKLTPARIQKLSEIEDRYLLDAQITIDSQTEFDRVRALFMKGSGVGFVPGKIYSLRDFLPPLPKSLVNKLFRPIYWDTEVLKPYESKPEYGDNPIFNFLMRSGLSSFSNCWNTTTQVLRSLHPAWDRKVQLYWPGRDSISYDMRDPQYSVKVSESQVRPGDVVIFSLKSTTVDDQVIQHTAILHTRDVVFEKTDGGENDPWRLALLKDVISKYRRLLGADYAIEYRRFEGKKIYPGFVKDAGPGDEITKLFKKFYKDIDTSMLNYGCEIALGGGCDGVITVVEPLELKGASLLAPSKTLSRFIDL